LKFQLLIRFITVTFIAFCFCITLVYADDQELARASQNPVAAMISVPMKNKFHFNAGPEDAFIYEMELQPVYPMNFGEINLINRFIIPITYQEGLYPGMDDEFGLRNITYQAFFSPAKPGAVIWGLGPAIMIPTNTDDSLANDNWAAGPAAVALTIQGPWVSGFLAQQLWDFAGNDDTSDVNLSTLQYFINYNTPHYYLNTSPTMAYNWEANSDDAWTIPIGGGIGKIFHFNEKPVDMRISAYWNAKAPESAPEWFTELQIKFMFPKK